MGRIGKAIVIDGKEFISRAAAMRYYGISDRTVKSRIDGGWTLEAAISEPARKGNYDKKNIIYCSLDSTKLCPSVKTICTKPVDHDCKFMYED